MSRTQINLPAFHLVDFISKSNIFSEIRISSPWSAKYGMQDMVAGKKQAPAIAGGRDEFQNTVYMYDDILNELTKPEITASKPGNRRNIVRHIDIQNSTADDLYTQLGEIWEKIVAERPCSLGVFVIYPPRLDAVTSGAETPEHVPGDGRRAAVAAVQSAKKISGILGQVDRLDVVQMIREDRDGK